MNKEEIYAYLREKGVHFEAAEHAAVYNMEELEALALPHPEADAKNLFVRDDRRSRYLLITVRGDKRVDLKAFRRRYGMRPLSFATAEELAEILALEPGSVTPLGLLNDGERRAEFWLDAGFLEGDTLIACHPNENTATVWLDARDLISLIEEHGNEVHTAEL